MRGSGTRRQAKLSTAPLLHIDRVGWAEFSPDSQRVLSASSDNTARIWEAHTGKPVGPPLQHLRTVTKAVFSPDGRRLATASLDRTARIWDARTSEALTPPSSTTVPSPRFPSAQTRGGF